MGKGKTSQIVVVVFSVFLFILPNSILAKYSGGTGEPNNPYQIANATDLLTLAADTNDYNKCFILTADINLPGEWVFMTAVIARDTTNTNRSFDGIAFTGTFDGAGHKITNLTIDTNGAGNDYLGLFGYVSGGEIKNLGLRNVSITGGDYSLYLGGLAGESYGSINNCYSRGAVIGGNYSVALGGLVGAGGNISNCYSTGAVIGGNWSEALGGLVGGGGDISNCYSTSNVSGGDDPGYLGGLLGDCSGTISNCYSTGTVTGGYWPYCAGGLVGEAWEGGISNCYSTGAVVGGDESYALGGLVGQSWSVIISNCHSTGNVSGGDNSTLGGLVGGFGEGAISSYFLITSGPDNGIGKPLTDEEMKQQSSFVGWDFIETWGIEDNQTRPFLKLTYSVGDLNRDKNIDFFDLAILASHWLEGL